MNWFIIFNIKREISQYLLHLSCLLNLGKKSMLSTQPYRFQGS
jgi:hypothetical protein